jgi:hypothetical protein
MITYDMLLPTIPHRHAQLLPLLAELDRQWQPGFGMLLMRDNLQRSGDASYGKWNDLLALSQADYVSWAGDDDWVAPDFIPKIMTALESKPDYVGFQVRYTESGQVRVAVEHSLRYGCWASSADMLMRDIVHHNPIRRELAQLATWSVTHQSADVTWANDLRATGRVRTEAWIGEQMYHYRQSNNTWTARGSSGMPSPLPASEIRPLPEYPWLTCYDQAFA